MVQLTGLKIFVDQRDSANYVFTARLDAELDNGEVVVLLDDRGWSSGRHPGLLTENYVVESARMVVGPDEAFSQWTDQDMEDGHWETLQEKLAAAGIQSSVDQLKACEQPVVISPAVRDLLDRESPGPDSLGEL